MSAIRHCKCGSEFIRLPYHQRTWDSQYMCHSCWRNRTKRIFRATQWVEVQTKVLAKDAFGRFAVIQPGQQACIMQVFWESQSYLVALNGFAGFVDFQRVKPGRKHGVLA